jgi:hypothetical protein
MQLRYCQVDSDIGNLFLPVYNKGEGGRGWEGVGRDVLLTFDGFCMYNALVLHPSDAPGDFE